MLPRTVHLLMYIGAAFLQHIGDLLCHMHRLCSAPALHTTTSSTSPTAHQCVDQRRISVEVKWPCTMVLCWTAACSSCHLISSLCLVRAWQQLPHRQTSQPETHQAMQNSTHMQPVMPAAVVTAAAAMAQQPARTSWQGAGVWRHIRQRNFNQASVGRVTCRSNIRACLHTIK